MLPLDEDLDPEKELLAAMWRCDKRDVSDDFARFFRDALWAPPTAEEIKKYGMNTESEPPSDSKKGQT